MDHQQSVYGWPADLRQEKRNLKFLKEATQKASDGEIELNDTNLKEFVISDEAAPKTSGISQKLRDALTVDDNFRITQANEKFQAEQDGLKTVEHSMKQGYYNNLGGQLETEEQHIEELNNDLLVEAAIPPPLPKLASKVLAAEVVAELNEQDIAKLRTTPPPIPQSAQKASDGEIMLGDADIELIDNPILFNGLSKEDLKNLPMIPAQNLFKSAQKSSPIPLEEIFPDASGNMRSLTRYSKHLRKQSVKDASTKNTQNVANL